MREVTLPSVESSELELTNYKALTVLERECVDELMGVLIVSARNSGFDFWMLNPQANSVRECLSQWVADRRPTSTIGAPVGTTID